MSENLRRPGMAVIVIAAYVVSKGPANLRRDWMTPALFYQEWSVWLVLGLISTLILQNQFSIKERFNEEFRCCAFLKYYFFHSQLSPQYFYNDWFVHLLNSFQLLIVALSLVPQCYSSVLTYQSFLVNHSLLCHDMGFDSTIGLWLVTWTLLCSNTVYEPSVYNTF